MAVNACLAAGGGIVQFPPGNFKQLGPVTANVNDTAVYIQGSGRIATTIYYYGSGDSLRIYDSSNYSARVNFGGGLKGLTIDGTNTSGAATGLHMGDIFQYEVDFSVQNFTVTGSIGAHFDNEYYWTEQLHGDVFAVNCASHVVFDTGNTGTNSFARAHLTLWIDQSNANINGVVLQNGAVIYDGAIGIFGNFTSSSTPLTGTPAVLTLHRHRRAKRRQLLGHAGYQPEHRRRVPVRYSCAADDRVRRTGREPDPGRVRVAGLRDLGELLRRVEHLHPAGARGAVVHRVHPGRPDSVPGPGDRPVPGDQRVAGVHAGLHGAGRNGGMFSVLGGDFFNITLSENATIEIDSTDDFSATAGVPQRLTVVLQQVRFPALPVHSHVAEQRQPHHRVSDDPVGVGGNVPQMSTAANAVDVYYLQTVNGATWYGTAVQASQVADTEQFQCLSGTRTFTNNTNAQNGDFQRHHERRTDGGRIDQLFLLSQNLRHHRAVEFIAHGLPDFRRYRQRTRPSSTWRMCCHLLRPQATLLRHGLPPFSRQQRSRRRSPQALTPASPCD